MGRLPLAVAVLVEMADIAFHRLLWVNIYAALTLVQNVVTGSAFALTPSSAASINKIPKALVEDGEENIDWKEDWMLRFGGVARCV